MTQGLPPALSVRALGLSYGATRILDGIDLTLPAGEVLALLGPSGSGKTTLLRLLAGLLRPDAGRIEIAGKAVADPGRGLFAPPERRGLGMVFQDYALWPHLSVARNVAFPLEMQRCPTAERRARVTRALERVGLAALAERRPSELSGGQQQRVAIARAIVAEPPLVLFDEPLSNLDRELRETMVDEIAALVADLKLSAVYVTHDHAEALALADRIAVMRDGGIAQLAAPATLIDAPASAGIAAFLRLGTLLPASRTEAGWTITGSRVALPDPPNAPAGAAARVLLPERALAPAATASPDARARLAARVLRVQVRASGFALTLRLAGTEHEVALLSPRPAAPGDDLELAFAPEALRWFPATDDPTDHPLP
ncbi:ABC transporter ATP-binding protein [Pseudooceanicola sp. CBS1P-1]|uniref:ATP-binding cassette domain-containing protein n=1 Tax=Pseudooceanicola albus TaxID=2692189 RepID=A0A6L7G8H2_9RHOB|nr:MULTISPECIES: ABC transporter ATP-binding protein [Pseudooceanicola]MBT9386316.1 ABC transporter ATP-binding protein [Pseudooceanicola endophyticus]MXN20365.1 ATP-binding cassette domain-containing protein [Pseudooceanicola albus]